MEQEELLQRLTALEDARAADLQKAAQQQFMSKYGSRISNNEGLGLVILNELNKQGVDTSAADEAVTAILDKLRMDAQALLDTIKENNQTAKALMDEVDSMKEAVVNAAEQTGVDLSLPSEEQAIPPAGAPAEEDIPSPEDGSDEFNPDEIPADFTGEAPAPEEPAPEGPAAEAAPAPMPEAPVEQQDTLPPEQMVSDQRLKHVLKATGKAHTVLSDIRAKKIISPLGHILSACGGN